MRSIRVAFAAALVFTATGDVRLMSQTRSPQATKPYASAATAVLVDVVVRDKQGRPVFDLAAADFTLAEDGVQQKIDSFTRVSRGGGIGVGISWKTPRTTIATTTPASSDDRAPASPSDEGTTAIVFDHLSSESLRLAQRAALEYIPLAGQATDRVGVFATDPGIRVVQGYTTDRTRVRQAVGRVLPSGTSAQEQTAERTDDLMERRRELRGQTASTVAGSAGGGAALAGMASAIGERETELRMLQTELNMIRSFDNLDRDHRGYDTSIALLSIVRSLAEYPGRKAIMLFSEGLPVSPVLSARLDHVIDAANRANVTAYAVDASGLRAKSTTTSMRREIDGFVEERLQQLATGTERTEQPLAMAFERIEDTLTLDSRAGLARLADQTGGLLFEGSNDLSSVFRRIDEDNQFHYVLTYSPRNTAFDGKFRAINVKVRRPGTQVFARKGYRAARAAGGRAPGAGESAALAMLTRRPLPNAFETQAAGFTFPDPAHPGLAALLVRVRTGVLRFDVDAERSTYAGEASILVRIRDGDGREVQKVSQDYLLAGDARDVDAARNGEILFYREVELDPGVYTIESVVFDSTAQQGSARVATLTVPGAAPSALGMSSLILVDRVEQLSETAAAGADAVRPLYVGRTLIYPNLGQPIRKDVASELPFFFTLYGPRANTTVHAQLLRNGQALAEAPVQVASDAGVRAQHLGRLPIDTLTPGTYELRIRAKSGAHEVSRGAFFTVE
jgi:VWFA-related protein